MAKREQILDVLNQRGYHVVVKVEEKAGSDPFWQTYITKANLGWDLGGEWFLTTYWRYKNDPAGKASILHESSAGLNVESDPFGLCAGAGQDRVCVVRYDFDARQTPQLHLNVLQPAPLHDNAHWRLPIDASPNEWDAVRVLAYLLDRAAADLKAAGWS